MTVNSKAVVAILFILAPWVLNISAAGAADFGIVDGQTVVDQAGRRIAVKKPFSRIISLYGAHTENLFALSGGERQRVVFARALAQDTPVLILDEATSNLDISHAIRLLGLAARKVQAESHTVLGVFQDINQAAVYCDHLIFMRRGTIAAHGATREVLTPEILRSVFNVEAKVYFDDYCGALQVVYKN